MGAGIAHAAAVAGLTVRITDADERAVAEALGRIRTILADGVARSKMTADNADAAFARIAGAPDLEPAVAGADLVIEAVVEDLDVKRRVFARADAAAPPTTILATNTSSLSVSRIADATKMPSRVIGMHFFNPVHIMPLVELVTHPRTDLTLLPSLHDLVAAMKKTAIVVRDTPGFASSRLGLALGLEAMRMLEAGVATAADIDTAMELGYGHPMGPLRLTDLVGLDVRLKIAEYLHRELADEQFAPPRVLREKVARGELGKKTGKGFYEW